MPKLLEKTGAELFASLANIAAPVGNIAKDEALFSALADCIRSNAASPLRNNNLVFLMSLYADLAPLLLTDAHMQDIVAILAEIEGCDAKEMLGMNGADLVADCVKAWKEQLGPFFERAGLSALTQLFLR